MDRDRLRACTSHDLIASAAQLGAALSSTHAALLDILAIIDERELWRSDGCCSMSDWITFRLGLSRKSAHEWAEAARALGELPQLAGAFAAGTLSWDKTKAVASMATPESDAALTAEAHDNDAMRLERAARRVRGVSVKEAQRRHQERFLALRRSPAMGGVRLSGFLPDVDGETVLKAITLLAEDVPKDADTGLYPPLDKRCADALVDLASDHLASEQSRLGERALVVTHAELDGDGSTITHAELEGGIVIASATAERLMCDALVEPVTERGGLPMGVGRKSRRPPGRLRRQLVRRDLCCRFPGCTRTRVMHSHHLTWWNKNGPTEPGNLSLLCRYHHRLMHEGGWSLRGDPNGVLEFVKPSGEVLESRAPELSDEVKDRILGPNLPGPDPPD